MKIINLLLFVFSFTLFISCTNKNPQIVSDPRPEVDTNIVAVLPSNPIISLVRIDNNYCRLDDRGFIMRFQNSGTLESSEIQGKITFNDFAPIPFEIPKIPANMGGINGFKEVIITIPNGCFSSDCHFFIQWSNQPAVSGVCIG